MAIRILPPAPSRTDDPDTFIAKTDAWMTTLPGVVDDMNATATSMSSVAAGGAYAIPYKFSTTLTQLTDPGSGFMRFDNANVNTTTSITLSSTSAAGLAVNAYVQSFNQSTSSVKGSVRISSLDGSRYAVYNITSMSSGSGYNTFSLSFVSTPGASAPFANNETVLLFFQRTGDIGTPGTLVRRTTSSTTGTTSAPNMDQYDMAVFTALSSSLTFNAPTGTLTDGRQLMYRVKDDGTSRALAFSTAYRAGTDLPFPTATVAGKTLYMGFIYNAADAKWDLTAVLNNI